MSCFKSSRKEEGGNKGYSCGIWLMKDGHKLSRWEAGSDSPPLGFMLAVLIHNQPAVQDGAE